jgi:hypothetical protein
MYWPVVEKWIDDGYLACDLPMPDDIIEQLESGHKQLWVAVEMHHDKVVVLCAVLTSLAKMRSGLYCQVVCAGGSDVKRWIGCMRVIEKWAREEGCCKITVQGRPGWAKLLPSYRRVQVVLELEIPGEQHDRDQNPAIGTN